MPTTSQQWTTLAFVVAVAAVVIAWDVWTIQAHGVNSSISRVCRRLFATYPTIFVAAVFAAGCIVGHIWMPTE